MTHDPKRLVERGYDSIADRFGAWRAALAGSPDEEWVGELFARLPKAAAVLELGCGRARRPGRSSTRGTSTPDDWLGVTMFFGSYTDDDTLALLARAGLAVERAEVVPIVEPEGEASFLWVLAARGRAAQSH